MPTPIVSTLDVIWRSPGSTVESIFYLPGHAERQTCTKITSVGVSLLGQSNRKQMLTLRKALSVSVGICCYDENHSPEWLPCVVGNEECIEWREEEEAKGGREG